MLYKGLCNEDGNVAAGRQLLHDHRQALGCYPSFECTAWEETGSYNVSRACLHAEKLRQEGQRNPDELDRRGAGDFMNSTTFPACNVVTLYVALSHGWILHPLRIIS